MTDLNFISIFRDINLWDNVFGNNSFHSPCESLENSLKANIVKWFQHENQLDNRKLQILNLGIFSLNLFIQANWTGPPFSFLKKEDDSSSDFDAFQFWRLDDKEKGDDFGKSNLEILNRFLVLDGEAIDGNAKHLHLLLLAETVFRLDLLDNFSTRKWWLLRSLFLHQQILEEPSKVLHDQIFQLGEELLKSDEFEGESKAALHLEIAQAHLYYTRVGPSQLEIEKALQLLGMAVSVIGALGKRTRYQQREVAQLTIRVDAHTGNSLETTEHSGKDVVVSKNVDYLPKNVQLEDEVNLDGINFTEPGVGEQPDLTPLQQAAILALFCHKLRSQPKDNLQKEEVSPYLSCLVCDPKSWSIQTTALLFRSRVELNTSRTVDRSLKQLEVLTSSFAQADPPFDSRVSEVFFCSHLPPRWKVESDLAAVLISLGAVRSALDVYLRLEMWEEVVACYNLLQLRHKAAEVIRDQMASKGETVKLWCWLGDATDDVTCYEKAWEMSEGRSAVAQRHWGNYHYGRKQYAECIQYLEKSLEINSLQTGLWFRLGFAALQVENWPLASKCFHRYTTLEPDSFEAWNNLGKAYVKQSRKGKAYYALKEAVKCNYENWKVWDNLMAISTDVADFDQVVTCYHRVLDLKGKKDVDEEVLKILVRAVEENLKDSNGNDAAVHRENILKLFGRITSEVQGNAVVWQLYSRLLATGESDTEIQNGRIAQCLQKAHRASTQGRWSVTTETTASVLKLCANLADAYLVCASRCSLPKQAVGFLSSAKFAIKGVITTVEKEYTDMVTGEIKSELENDFKQLKEKLVKIESEMAKL